jgi:predicted DNA-binding protein with PD1-like motif
VRSEQLNPVRTFFLVFDREDDVMATVRTFAEQNGIRGGHFVAIGALSRATIAWWSWSVKEYEKREVEEQLEVLALVGDITVEDGRTKVHAHVTLGRRDGVAVGGHLFEGTVRPTLEMQIFDYGRPLTRKRDAKTQLSLIALNGDGEEIEP